MAWLAATQLVRASEAASEHAAARAQRRRDQREVTADEEPFTAGRHHAIRSMTSTQVTATSSLEAIAAAADSAARAHLHTLNIPGRERHSERAQKARPKFRHATATKATVTGKPQVTIARADENKIDIMRAVSIYEALRSRQLTPEALVSLLAAYETADHAEASAPTTGSEVRQRPRPHRSQSPKSTI